jgi:microcystin-dependent protein
MTGVNVSSYVSGLGYMTGTNVSSYVSGLGYMTGVNVSSYVTTQLSSYLLSSNVPSSQNLENYLQKTEFESGSTLSMARSSSFTIVTPTFNVKQSSSGSDNIITNSSNTKIYHSTNCVIDSVSTVIKDTISTPNTTFWDSTTSLTSIYNATKILLNTKEVGIKTIQTPTTTTVDLKFYTVYASSTPTATISVNGTSPSENSGTMNIKGSTLKVITTSGNDGTTFEFDTNEFALKSVSTTTSDNPSIGFYNKASTEYAASIRVTNGTASASSGTMGITAGTINITGSSSIGATVNTISLPDLNYKFINPVGTILMYVGTVAPPGYLLCDGTDYLNLSYSNLFAIIRYTYGGNGTTTFGTPDLRLRFPLGIGTPSLLTSTLGPGVTGGSFTILSTQIPDHTHDVTIYWGTGNVASSGNADRLNTLTTNSTFSNNVTARTTYPNGTNGQPYYQPYTFVNYIIKH